MGTDIGGNAVPKELDYWRRRVEAVIRRFMPVLRIERLALNQDGMMNDVVLINNEFVFRFAKTEENFAVLENEARILALVRLRSGVSVPSPIYYERGCMVYPFLGGQPLLRETLRRMDEEAQTRMAEELAGFLYALHTTPLSEPGREVLPTIAPATRERLIDIRTQVREKVYPLLLPHQVQWAEALYASMLDDELSLDYDPVLIHGDLAPYHILYEDARRGIAGVLDFGVAGVGDAAQDFGTLISAYGESFVTRMRGVYPDLEKLLPRARSRCQTGELEWVLLGIETGEAFWFTAHLGTARDMLA